MTQSIVLGGPWYGSKVDARLAQSMVQFVAHSEAAGVRVVDMVYEDGMLDLARNRLLAGAIHRGVDWLVSVDSDCSFMDQAEAIGRALQRGHTGMVAIVGAPVKQGTGEWNVLDLSEKRVARPSSAPEVVGSIGFGFVAFRCGWYAQNWPRLDVSTGPRPFSPFFQTVIYPDPHSRFCLGAWGEDFGHCKAVRDRGGHVICDASIRVKHHMVRPGHPWAKDE